MTTNQFTTIAALPSGGGCMASLPAEVVAQAARPYLGIPAALLAERGDPGPRRALVDEEFARRYLAACRGEEVPAGPHGFEPFEYTERS